MATQYTPILQLALPVTGELNGTWGDVVNDNITSMVEEAIAGLATISTWTANVHTLTTANGTTDEARCAMLVLQTGAGGTALSGAGQVVCPAESKLYVVKNDAAYAVTVKTSGGSGVAIAAGDTAFVFCDGTNVNACVTQIINGHITGNLTVDGNTTLGNSTTDTITATARFNTDLLPSADNSYDLGTSGNSWRNLYIDGTATIATLNVTTIDTTNLEVTNIKAKDGTAAITLADSTGVATLAANPVLTSGAANGVAYLNGSKVLTTGSALTFDGTNLGVGTASPASKLDVNGAIRSIGSAAPSSGVGIELAYDSGSSSSYVTSYNRTSSAWVNLTLNSANTIFGISGSEQMRLTSTGLGIGTSSPAYKLDINTTANSFFTGIQVRNLSNGASATSSIAVGNDTNLTAAAFFINSSTNTGFAGANSLNIYQGLVAPMAFYTSGAERMRLDSSGNLGLGVTPSAWSASGVLQVSRASVYSSGGFTAFANNWYSSGGDKYIASDYATQYYQSSGQHVWRTAPSGTAGNAITFTQAMTLDASGNLGIGTSSPTTRLQITASGATQSWLYANNGTSGSYFGTSGTGETIVYQTGAYPIQFYTNSAERMRIDSSGNVLIGTSSAISPLTVYKNLSANNATDTAISISRSGTTYGSTLYHTYSTTTVSDAFGILVKANASLTDPQYTKYLVGDNGIHIWYGATTATERMRIDSSGNLLVGTTSTTLQSGFIIDVTAGGTGVYTRAIIGHSNGTGSGEAYAQFKYNNGVIGSITQSGTTAVAYNTSSDYRLKENIQPMQNALERNDKLKPCVYTWKADGSAGEGFVAHELQAVCPDAVTGEKDAVDAEGNPVYQGIDTSFLVGHLVACVQELTAKIKELEAKVG